MNRTIRAEIAKQTISILDTGTYVSPSGRRVELHPSLAQCVAGTELLDLVDLERMLASVDSLPVAPVPTPTHLQAFNETTLSGISKLLSQGAGPVAALNFASAKNPGGGFLGGSQAQEESLARSSGLYSSLMTASPYYEDHRKGSSSFYTDRVIVSPGCPVFRDDDGTLLNELQIATFLSCAAPNAGAIKENSLADAKLIGGVLRQRAEYVLAAVACRGYRNLVLGAWGCGVFRNDPVGVAVSFMTLLRSPRWSGRFAIVRFSVFDASPSSEVFDAFERAIRSNA